MAADILIQEADVVPVGVDQQQHIEITLDIASAFNATYGKVLTSAEGVVDPEVGTIPGIDGRKMSKSYANEIPVLASPEDLRRRVMRIVTEARPPEEPKDPNEILIYQLYRHVASSGKKADMADGFRSGTLAYGEAKRRLFEALDQRYEMARLRFAELERDPKYLQDVLEDGAIRARNTSGPLLDRVRTAIGVRPTAAGRR
jgi:tryptophanyl-tRNA synthetase